jgi:hypothetical protein
VVIACAYFVQISVVEAKLDTVNHV